MIQTIPIPFLTEWYSTHYTYSAHSTFNLLLRKVSTGTTVLCLVPLCTGDNWCQLIIDGPMSRPVCCFELLLTPAECGVLLSRVHQAEQLEELSLEIYLVSLHSTGTLCSCGRVCSCTFTCVLVYYVSGNRMIFGCLCVWLCICWIVSL